MYFYCCKETIVLLDYSLISHNICALLLRIDGKCLHIGECAVYLKKKRMNKTVFLQKQTQIILYNRSNLIFFSPFFKANCHRMMLLLLFYSFHLVPHNHFVYFLSRDSNKNLNLKAINIYTWLQFNLQTPFPTPIIFINLEYKLYVNVCASILCMRIRNLS